MENAKKEILEAGMVTAEIKAKYFYGVGFGTIRNELEKMGLDRHMAIGLRSTEIAILTPFGVMMQIRGILDMNQLGLWGGALNDGETPEDGAIRELWEETHLKVDKNQLEFVEVNEHSHEYSNGDKALYECYRYILRLDYVPKITIDEESTGTCLVAHTILDHQHEFIKRVLGEK